MIKNFDVIHFIFLIYICRKENKKGSREKLKEPKLKNEDWAERERIKKDVFGISLIEIKFLSKMLKIDNNFVNKIFKTYVN